MIPACRLLPFRANRLANIIAGGIMTLVNGFLTFVLPLTNGDFRDPVSRGDDSGSAAALGQIGVKSRLRQRCRQ